MGQAIIKLSLPQLSSNISLEETILRRKPVRRYRAEALVLSQLSQILWSAQGITGEKIFRAAPSAGATYPLEVIVFVGRQSVNVSKNLMQTGQAPEALQAGIYRYEADSHSLSLHKPGDLRPNLARAALDQEFVSQAPVDIVICTLCHKTSSRYGRRGERYVLIEVGHVSENIHLQALGLGLATVEVGAFHDEEVKEILGIGERIRPLYIMPLGKPL